MIIKNIQKYNTGSLTKTEFIDAMYLQHKYLFEYAELLSNIDIVSIEIKDGQVIFTSKEDQIKFITKKPDKRTAPFEIMNFGDYESQDAKFLYEIIADGDTIFDIGANIGWYSMSFAKKKPSSIIHAFEPLPETFSSLISNININHISNVVCNNFGFSSEAKTLTFYTSAYTSVSNSAINITDDIFAKEIKCEVITMDSYVSKNNINVDIIKCDVEGAELSVFLGGEKTISKNLPIVFTEMLRKWAAKFGYHPNDIIAFFSKLGYKCFHTNENHGLTLSPIASVNNSTVNTNFFFLHPDKHVEIIKKYGL
jgi:FkbM family methyltransferase